MSDELCVICRDRPAHGAYACVPCGVTRPRAWLAEIADMVPAARDIAQRQARHGTGGGASGKPGSSVPIDLGATARLDAVQSELTTWTRHIAEERGVNRAEINASGLMALSRIPEWVDPLRGLTDDLSGLAMWLADHCEWMRHRPEVDEWLRDVEACARVVRSVVNRHQPGRYAGPCSTVNEDGQTCGQDVLARPGANFGTCRSCGAEYDVDEQQEWMRKEIEGFLARPIEISGILLRLGFKVGYSTIAAYAAKGQLAAHGQDEKGRPLFRIGDVMNLRMGVKAS